jgi:hypothetical protein
MLYMNVQDPWTANLTSFCHKMTCYTFSQTNVTLHWGCRAMPCSCCAAMRRLLVTAVDAFLNALLSRCVCGHALPQSALLLLTAALATREHLSTRNSNQSAAKNR